MKLIDLDAEQDYLLDGKYKVGSKDNCPTKCIANVHVDKDELQALIDKAIVRCKECKFNTTVEHNPVCAVFGVPMDVNDYCSYGERIEDEC